MNKEEHQRLHTLLIYNLTDVLGRTLKLHTLLMEIKSMYNEEH